MVAIAQGSACLRKRRCARVRVGRVRLLRGQLHAHPHLLRAEGRGGGENDHKPQPQDVAWHPFDRNLLASCGDDCRVLFYDVREAASVASLTAHAKEVNAVAFNPVEQFLFATGSSDATVALWDHRNTTRPLHSLLGHKAEVYSLAWSPSSASVLASAGVDRRVNLWDISRVGEEEKVKGRSAWSCPRSRRRRARRS
mgnify:CR=1 FL=1